MESNTELICCAGCGAPLDVDGELIRCKVCGATNLLGERAAKALQHLKKVDQFTDSVPMIRQGMYGSAMHTSSAVFYPMSYTTRTY